MGSSTGSPSIRNWTLPNRTIALLRLRTVAMIVTTAAGSNADAPYRPDLPWSKFLVSGGIRRLALG